MTPVYVVTSRGVLHRGALAEGGGTLVDERCNTDQSTSRGIYEDEAIAARDAKRHCRRCFQERTQGDS